MKRPSWTAVPAARSSLPVLKIRLWVITGLLLLAAGAGVFSFVAWSSFAPQPPDLRAAAPQAAGIARVAAEDFLAGRVADFPIAEGIAPNFRPSSEATPFVYRSLIDNSWRRELVESRLIETHVFLVTTETRTMFLTVPIALDGDTPTLTAYPTLLPAFVSQGTPSDPLDYADSTLKVDQVPAPVTEVLAEWGRAYAADDTAELRRIVGDQSASDGSYRGLGGFALDTLPIVVTPLQTPTGFVIRVRLVLTTETADGSVLSIDLDVLVQGTAGNLPNVVAWGPVGSGPLLTPFQNRL